MSTSNAVLDGDGEILERFVYGSRAYVPDYMVTDDGTFAFVTDHLGSPRLVVDVDTGQVVQEMEFDAFGQVFQDTAEGFQPFGYAGGLYEPETGLVRFGARDYDPATGRWTAKDPIGFVGGDTNLYGYAFQDPVNLIDPHGTLAIVAGIWAVAEVAMSAYDIYDAQRTVRDPCEGLVSKVVAVGAVAAGIVLPGGGYGAVVRKGREARNWNRLNKSYASQEQMAETGTAIAGGADNVAPFRNAERFADRYGGSPDDWTKMTSSSYTAPDGTQFQTHWVENVNTGFRTEIKTKITSWNW